MKTSRYENGSYFAETGGTWHLEDAAFKAEQVMKMLGGAGLKPATICEIGCGAGGILAELRTELPRECRFVGYEISPQAHELSKPLARENLTFVLGDAFEDHQPFDLVLVMDVVEHVEDVFAFLRNCRAKGEAKIYHIPLDISMQTALRDRRFVETWRGIGHLHRFSLGSALEALKYTDHEILDYFLTPSALSCRQKKLRTRLANVLRAITGAFNPRLASRLFGGYSVLALCR